MPKPTTPKAPPPRVRRSKPEVERDFAGIREEIKAARETVDLKADEAEKRNDGEIRQAVQAASVDGTVERISKLGIEVSRALSGIMEQLVTEVGHLTTLRAAVELERGELERLHKIDVTAAALDLLVQDYEKKQAGFESEMATRQSVWDEQVAGAERERKEQDDLLKKQRQRDIDDYEYKKNLERKRAQDKYDEEVRQQEKKNLERQDALEKNWAQRDAALKDREEEIQRLRQEAAGFPARVESEVQRASVQAAKEAAQQAERQTLLAGK